MGTKRAKRTNSLSFPLVQLEPLMLLAPFFPPYPISIILWTARSALTRISSGMSMT